MKNVTYTCDLCGAPMDEEHRNQINISRKLHILKKGWGIGLQDFEYELCNNCDDSLRKWFRSRQKDREGLTEDRIKNFLKAGSEVYIVVDGRFIRRLSYKDYAVMDDCDRPFFYFQTVGRGGISKLERYYFDEFGKTWGFELCNIDEKYIGGEQV